MANHRREYARDDGTPTWEALEEVVGGLESGKAVAFASGMAAIASVFDQLSAGAVVVLPDDCYQGVAGLAAAGAERGRWSVQRVAVDDTAGWIRACTVADLIWLESPSSPLLTRNSLPMNCESDGEAYGTVSDVHRPASTHLRPGSLPEAQVLTEIAERPFVSFDVSRSPSCHVVRRHEKDKTTSANISATAPCSTSSLRIVTRKRCAEKAGSSVASDERIRIARIAALARRSYAVESLGDMEVEVS